MSAIETIRGRELATFLAEILGGPTDRPPRALATLSDILEPLLAAGTASLAWWGIRNSPLASTPAGQRLHQAYRFHAVQVALHEEQLRRALTVLRGAGIEPCVAKGWAVARLYPEPGVRPYGDIDLYVRREEFEDARRALASPGNEDLPVDLHNGFALLDDRSMEDLESRMERVPFGSTSVTVLGREDHLRHLSLHMLGHGVWRPLWMCDLPVVLETHGSAFDWARLLRGDSRRTEWVVSALRLARELLGAKLEGAPSWVGGGRLPGWLRTAVWHKWGATSHHPHGTRMPMSQALFPPATLFTALRLRWPNPIEATVECRGGFNAWPRLPYQLGACLSRTLRFMAPKGGSAAASGAA